MLGKFCVIYIFASSLHHMAVIGKSHSFLIKSKFTSHKRGWFLIQRIVQCSRLCMGKVYLKLRSHKRGRVCVMNIRVLRLEYERGRILKVMFWQPSVGGGGGVI